MPLSIARSQSTQAPSEKRSRLRTQGVDVRELRLGELLVGDEFFLPWNYRGGTVVGRGADVHAVLDGESARDQEAIFSPALVVLAARSSAW